MTLFQSSSRFGTRSSSHLCALLSIMAGLAVAVPAHAGSWVFDGYQYQRNVKWDFQLWSNQFWLDQNPSNHLIESSQPNGTQEGFLPANDSNGSSYLFSETRCQFNNYYGGNATFQPMYSKTVTTVTPVFHWEASKIYNAGVWSDNPADSPPARLWYWVSSNVQLSRIHYLLGGSYPYSKAHPYNPDTHFQLVEMKNGIGTDPEPVVGGETDQPSDIGGAANVISGSKMEVVDTYGQKKVHGTTRTLICTLRSAPLCEQSNKREEMSASCFTQFQVGLISFRLAGRTKLQHPETDLDTDFDFGSSYGPPAPSVAAGGFETEEHEHQGDIVMQVTRPGAWGMPTGIQNLPSKLLPAVRLARREGVKKHAWLLKRAGVTNEQGKILRGVFYSHDLTDTSQNQTLAYPDQVPGVGLPLHQAWASVEWKMGQNGEKEWNPNFWVDTGEHKEWLWTKAMFTSTLPLTKHSMKFVVTRLEVREKNEDGHEVERIYTTMPLAPDAVPTAATGQTQVIVVPVIDASAYLKFDPAIVTDANNGIYKTQVTVLKDPDERLRHFIVELEDQGAFFPKP